MSRIRLTNIKGSFSLNHVAGYRDRVRVLCRRPGVRHCGNFFVLRGPYVFTVFWTGHVNVTGLRAYGDIDRALTYFREAAGGISEELEFRVDNICSTGNLGGGTPLILSLLRRTCRATRSCRRGLIVRSRYDPETFPALYIRTKLGAIHVFASGKFVFLGYRRQRDAEYLFGLLRDLMAEYDVSARQRLGRL